MRRSMMIGVFALALSACALNRPMTLPDGSQGQMISCPGSLQSMGDCYQKAGEICPLGYDIVGGGTEATPFAFGNATVGPHAGTATYSSGAIVQRSLMVRCHG
jgi:hypothetical protein